MNRQSNKTRGRAPGRSNPRENSKTMNSSAPRRQSTSLCEAARGLPIQSSGAAVRPPDVHAQGAMPRSDRVVQTPSASEVDLSATSRKGVFEVHLIPEARWCTRPQLFRYRFRKLESVRFRFPNVGSVLHFEDVQGGEHTWLDTVKNGFAYSNDCTFPY